jgi:serine/threonine protein phosphatase PrpC
VIAGVTAILKRWLGRPGQPTALRSERLAVASLSHTGLVRAGNQDFIDVDLASGIVALADGMGGHRGGDVARRLAVETVIEAAALPGDGTPAEVLANAVAVANRAVFERSVADSALGGMGTTLVVALFRDRRIFHAHVGDSRLYLLRDGRLRLLTRDHSLVQQVLDQGLFAGREQAHAAGVYDNVLTRSIGTRADVAADLDDQPLADGDLFLLCSDGLHGCVAEAEIARLLEAPGADLESLARALVDAALARGAPDNVSVVLARPRPG